MEIKGSWKKKIAIQEEMMANKVPIPYRDQCTHFLIPLNKCRQSEFYLPWKCKDQCHLYDKFQYELVMERMLNIREEEAKSIPFILKTANT